MVKTKVFTIEICSPLRALAALAHLRAEMCF